MATNLTIGAALLYALVVVAALLLDPYVGVMA